jgi:hypothetical protein
MYGQTGAGKTFTMLGRNFEDEFGILTLSLRDLFSLIREDKDKMYFISCEYFEIYNDKIYDLLEN